MPLLASALLAVAAAALPPASTPAPVVAPAIDHVVLVSVDGLHPAVLAPPHLGSLPAFTRLMRGPHTLEARTDADITVTLPNHLGMVTGLPATQHGWLRNDDPPGLRQGGTVHDKAGRYVPSVFDVAHDHGLTTGCFIGKSKFWLLEQSYGAARGAADITGEDDGKAKLDLFVFAEACETSTQQLIARLHHAASAGERSLDLLHFAEPDLAGHAHEWDLTPGSPYLRSIARVDASLTMLLAAIDANEALRGRTAIVLTTDHGGGAPPKTHTDAEAPCNFVIPFLVWHGRDGPDADLYELNPRSRARPSPLENPSSEDAPPPIRNSELGNLGLALLGLPSIPGSLFGGAAPLVLVPGGEGRRNSLPAPKERAGRDDAGATPTWHHEPESQTVPTPAAPPRPKREGPGSPTPDASTQPKRESAPPPAEVPSPSQGSH